MLVNARVQRVEPGVLRVAFKGKEGVDSLPFGLCVWSTGVGPQPLAQDLIAQLPDTQTNKRAIVTDQWLRVKGLPNVFAAGDCATIELPHLLQCVVHGVPPMRGRVAGPHSPGPGAP